MLKIQIKRVERGEENLVLVNSKKDKEGRKNLFSKPEKIENIRIIFVR